MAEITRNFTDELRARLSIVDVISRRIPLTKKGKDFWGCCPFHNEKTPSFKISEERGNYYCFGCGEKGDVISFVMKTQNMMYPDAIRELANMAGMKMPEFRPRDPAVAAREKNYFDIMESATQTFAEKLFDGAGAHALEYLRSRGFSDDVIKKYRIGYAPRGNILAAKFSNEKSANVFATGLIRKSNDGPGTYDFFRDRLMFPIMSAGGQVIAFSGRSLDGSEPKYINTGETEFFQKRRTVFGLNFARDSIYRANRSIVVEGQIDAIKMQINGFGETVAPLGTALTEEHLQLLCKMNRNITFCFDGDNAGQKAAARAVSIVAPLMRDTSDIRFAFVTGGKDPDDVLKKQNGRDDMKNIIDGAASWVDFLWDLANKNYVISTPNGRALADKFIEGEVEKVKDARLKSEIKNEYDQRKFNQWHKWKRGGVRATMKLPDIDAVSKKALSDIAVAFPELIEKHSEFFIKMGITFDDNNAPEKTNMTLADADKFIVSKKLMIYIENLQAEKRELTNALLSGDERASVQLKVIDSELSKSLSNLQKLADI